MKAGTRPKGVVGGFDPARRTTGNEAHHGGAARRLHGKWFQYLPMDAGGATPTAGNNFASMQVTTAARSMCAVDGSDVHFIRDGVHDVITMATCRAWTERRLLTWAVVFDGIAQPAPTRRRGMLRLLDRRRPSIIGTSERIRFLLLIGLVASIGPMVGLHRWGRAPAAVPLLLLALQVGVGRWRARRVARALNALCVDARGLKGRKTGFGINR